MRKAIGALALSIILTGCGSQALRPETVSALEEFPAAVRAAREALAAIRPVVEETCGEDTSHPLARSVAQIEAVLVVGEQLADGLQVLATGEASPSTWVSLILRLLAGALSLFGGDDAPDALNQAIEIAERLAGSLSTDSTP